MCVVHMEYFIGCGDRSKTSELGFKNNFKHKETRIEIWFRKKIMPL